MNKQDRLDIVRTIVGSVFACIDHAFPPFVSETEAATVKWLGWQNGDPPTNKFVYGVVECGASMLEGVAEGPFYRDDGVYIEALEPHVTAFIAARQVDKNAPFPDDSTIAAIAQSLVSLSDELMKAAIARQKIRCEALEAKAQDVLNREKCTEKESKKARQALELLEQTRQLFKLDIPSSDRMRLLHRTERLLQEVEIR